MDRILRRQLQRIERDEQSGANPLARQVVASLLRWLRRNPRPTASQLLDVARELLRTQPSMAPMLRLANIAALAADSPSPYLAFGESVRAFGRVLRFAPQQIATSFRKSLRTKHGLEFCTYSYSSLVARALVEARAHIKCVYCSESRPRNEGRQLATVLSKAGIDVDFSTDVTLLQTSQWDESILILGADAVMNGFFVNKIGADILLSNHSRRARPIWVLAETAKFWPGTPFNYHQNFWQDTHGHPWDVWKGAPKNVFVSSPLLKCARYQKSLRFLCELGWLAPAGIRRELRKIKISSRLRELAD